MREGEVREGEVRGGKRWDSGGEGELGEEGRERRRGRKSGGEGGKRRTITQASQKGMAHHLAPLNTTTFHHTPATYRVQLGNKSLHPQLLHSHRLDLLLQLRGWFRVRQHSSLQLTHTEQKMRTGMASPTTVHDPQNVNRKRGGAQG